jgi:hypothetical protein
MPPPGGLANGQRRARAVQLVAGADWYVAEKERFDFVGRGDVSEADLRSVQRELPEAIFVCVWRPRPVEELLPPGRSLGTRRIAKAMRSAGAVRPKLQWVAKGARVAVLPGVGVRFVDGERFYVAGETVPLPWTSPRIEMVVMRSAELSRAMREVIGPDGPYRAGRPDLPAVSVQSPRASMAKRLRRGSAAR